VGCEERSSIFFTYSMNALYWALEARPGAFTASAAEAVRRTSATTAAPRTRSAGRLLSVMAASYPVAPVPTPLLRGRDRVELRQVLVAQLQPGARDVLAQVGDRGGPGDQQDVRRALQQPGQRDRHRRRLLARGDRVQLLGLQRREA